MNELVNLLLENGLTMKAERHEDDVVVILTNDVGLEILATLPHFEISTFNFIHRHVKPGLEFWKALELNPAKETA